MLLKASLQWTLIFVFLLGLAACSKGDNVFKGKVHTVDVENTRILVIAQLKEEDLSKNYKEVLETNMYSQAIWDCKIKN